MKLYRCVTYGERKVPIDFGVYVAGSKVKVTVAKNSSNFLAKTVSGS